MFPKALCERLSAGIQRYSYQICLKILLIAAGTASYMTAKWADLTEAKSKDGTIRKFHHPFVQSWFMCVGMILCFFSFQVIQALHKAGKKLPEFLTQLLEGNHDFNPMILFLPSFCDILSTSLIFWGLNLTYSSSVLMLSGSAMVFVILLSRVTSKISVNGRQWCGIFIIVIGLLLVVLSDYIVSQKSYKPGKADTPACLHTTREVITGDLMIILAHLIASVQYIKEEKYLKNWNIPPLLLVGWEGVIGTIIMTLLFIPLHFIHVPSPFAENTSGTLEDVPDSVIQMMDKKAILGALILMAISIAVLNFSSRSLTKELTSTSTRLLSSIKVMLVWLLSLVLGWQKFYLFQALGFIILTAGQFMYQKAAIFSGLPPSSSISKFDVSNESPNDLEKNGYHYLP